MQDGVRPTEDRVPGARRRRPAAPSALQGARRAPTCRTGQTSTLARDRAPSSRSVTGRHGPVRRARVPTRTVTSAMPGSRTTNVGACRVPGCRRMTPIDRRSPRCRYRLVAAIRRRALRSSTHRHTLDDEHWFDSSSEWGRSRWHIDQYTSARWANTRSSPPHRRIVNLVHLDVRRYSSVGSDRAHHRRTSGPWCGPCKAHRQSSASSTSSTTWDHREGRRRRQPVPRVAL